MKFNISASSLATYLSSQLQFYFQYVLKAKMDTEVNTTYGNAGNAVHKCAEDYIKERMDTNAFLPDNLKKNITEKITNEMKYKKLFDDKWFGYRLNEMVGFNGVPLSYEEYKNSMINTLNYINQKPGIDIAEKYFLFPLIDSEEAEINVKGFIDAIDTTNHVVYDWKTNTSLSNFIEHAKMYCYAYMKMYNAIPKAIYYYAKLDKVQMYEFTERELLDFEKYILDVAKEIIEKGENISLYTPGDWQGNFNAHYKKCRDEVLKRDNQVFIDYEINKNYIKLENVPRELDILLDRKFSYLVNGHEFSDLFRTKKWDGKVHLYNERVKTLPLGLFSMMQELITDFNEYFNRNYILRLKEDYRTPCIEADIKYKFNSQKYEIRPYQEQAIKTAIVNRIGIIEMGTGAGKSLVAAEIIRRVNTHTLYVVNRIELVEQTIEMFEDYLGVKPGRIVEGKMELTKGIVVASIQSINAIMKRETLENYKIRKFLNQVGMIVYDECHNCKDAGTYKILSKAVMNANFIFGMTGTSFRFDEHTLRMKGLVGDVIYKKTTEELVKEGFLTPTQCLFLTNELIMNDNLKGNPIEGYHSEYDVYITNSNFRNELIKKIVEENPKKKILILTKLIKHGENLEQLIPGSKLITSKTNKNLRKEDFEDFKDSKYNVLIGSMQIFSTGINIPDLDILINASGNKTTVGTIQSIGRSMRKSEGKEIAYYYDFLDLGNKYFQDAAKQRMKILEEFGHEIKKMEIKN